MSLFRIHIRPSGGNPDMDATFQHCRENGLLGVGWRVGEFTETHDWSTYEKAARQVHDRIQQPRYIYDNVKPNDLVWTRDPNSQYYLTRVTSGWEYWTNQAGRQQDIDIANVFRCTFRDVPLDAVPGTVVYEGQSDHVDCLSRCELFDFLRKKARLFPESFRTKLHLVAKGNCSSGS